MTPSYSRLHDLIAERGLSIESRAGPTMELIDGTVNFMAGEVVSRPGFNLRLAFMELMQIIAGEFNIQAIREVAPKAKLELFTPQMAYGPRLRTQLPRVVSLLNAKPDSRQAMVFIGRPTETCTSDLPCTGIIHWLLRGGFLECVVYMRSWDVTLGLPIDIVSFGGVTLAIAHCLGVKPGMVTVHAGSMHYYKEYPVAWRSGIDNGTSFSLDTGVPTSVAGITRWARAHVADSAWPQRWPAGVAYARGNSINANGEGVNQGGDGEEGAREVEGSQAL